MITIQYSRLDITMTEWLVSAQRHNQKKTVEYLKESH